jgi:negative regulator of flagellin synthesis FlgM
VAARNLQGSKDPVMKLTGIFPPIKTEKVQVRKSEGSAAARAENAALPTDRVVLSAGSLEVQKAKDILDQTPDVRADRVQALKEEIARGEYQVDPYRLADKMMGSLLSETLVK